MGLGTTPHLLWTLIGLMATGCQGCPERLWPNTFSIIVKDQQSGESLCNAVVTVSKVYTGPPIDGGAGQPSWTLNADPDAGCTFSGACNCRRVEISAEHEGYSAVTIVVDLPQEECGPHPHKEVTLELEPQP